MSNVLFPMSTTESVSRFMWLAHILKQAVLSPLSKSFYQFTVFAYCHPHYSSPVHAVTREGLLPHHCLVIFHSLSDPVFVTRTNHMAPQAAYTLSPCSMSNTFVNLKNQFEITDSKNLLLRHCVFPCNKTANTILEDNAIDKWITHGHPEI